MRGEVRAEAERARLIDASRASGMSIKGFASREGIAASTLYQWLSAAKAAPRIARVIRRREARTEIEPSALILEVGRVRVHVSSGFDPDTLSAVLERLDARTSRS